MDLSFKQEHLLHSVLIPTSRLVLAIVTLISS